MTRRARFVRRHGRMTRTLRTKILFADLTSQLEPIAADMRTGMHSHRLPCFTAGQRTGAR
jgi:hypothetical protein